MKKQRILFGLIFPFFLMGCGSSQAKTSDDSSSQAISSSQSESLSTEPSSQSASESSYSDSASSSAPSESSSSGASTPSSQPSSASAQPSSSSSQPSSSSISSSQSSSSGSTSQSGSRSSSGSSSSEQSRIPDYVLHGAFGGAATWTDKAMAKNPSSATEYCLKGVSLQRGDVFKVHMSGNTWYGYSDVKNSVASGLVSRGESDDNIKVLTTGVYDIYSDTVASDDGHIYLAKVDGGDPTPGTVAVTGISLDRSGKFLKSRNEFILSATIYPSNATNQEIRWTSSDETIATVTSGGRVVAKEKKGSTTITAKTIDGGFVATCLVYVSSAIPEYYLTGRINGYDRDSRNYNFPAIPLSSSRYFIPDVNLKTGDQINVRGSNGVALKKGTNDYVFSVSQDMLVNFYLNLNDANQNYLSYEAK